MEKKSDLKLRLGLPGSESPERDSGLELRLDNNNGGGNKGSVSGAKRAFFDASVKWGLGVNGVGSELGLGDGSPRNCRAAKEVAVGVAGIVSPRNCRAAKEVAVGVAGVVSPKPVPEKKIDGAPAAKAEVKGWPPIRSYRKNALENALASSSEKKNENDDMAGLGSGSGSGSLFVKVSMDGAPYLRKVDLKTWSNYTQLSSALKAMFSSFTCGRDGLKGSNLKDINGSEYVLTFKDKDGDWMLVGDVPWEMFTDSCKKLRIMKGSEAIGLAPRASERCEN